MLLPSTVLSALTPAGGSRVSVSTRSSNCGSFGSSAHRYSIMTCPRASRHHAPTRHPASCVTAAAAAAAAGD